MNPKLLLPSIISLQCFGISPKDVISKANQEASEEPKSSQFFNAAMVYEWEPNRLYQLYTKPERITDIVLEAGENIISIAGGDSQRWTISKSQSGKESWINEHIFVKPHQMGISNNLVITTDKRTYHIELHALEHVPYQSCISWNYPASSIILDISHKDTKPEQKPLTPMSGLNHKQLNFNYHFVTTNRPAWMPRRVFDDGQKTYIEFPESMQATEAPIIYGLSKTRDEEVLNYRRYLNFYIIDHLIDLAEISIGGKTNIKVGIEREQG